MFIPHRRDLYTKEIITDILHMIKLGRTYAIVGRKYNVGGKTIKKIVEKYSAS
jgi:hypothetical protein